MTNSSTLSCSTAAILVILLVSASASSAQTGSTSTLSTASTAEKPRLQASGQLAIKDRYGKSTLLDVSSSDAQSSSGRTYTSGDRLDRDMRVLAVRMGEHIGVAINGVLWEFPLAPGSTGSSEIVFDSTGVSTRVRWSVEKAGEQALLTADVSIPTNYGAIGTDKARLTGTWKAYFDATAPIPVRSELKVQLNTVSQTANEFTITSWLPRP
jgi:hypothetical protein